MRRRAAGDLVTSALATRLDRTHQVPADSRQRALLRRVFAFIDTRLDPALWDTPVSRIATRWGFASPAHFSRTFRDAYELTPVAYRSNGHHSATVD